MMPTSLLIGLDVGWSEMRRTCGLAVLGAPLEEAGTVTYGDVSAVALFKRDVARVLSPAVQHALGDGRRVLVVADAIVGPTVFHEQFAASTRSVQGLGSPAALSRIRRLRTPGGSSPSPCTRFSMS